MLSESTERLEVLRPLSLPPDGKAKPADRRREGKSRGEHFKHESEPLSAARRGRPNPLPRERDPHRHVQVGPTAC